MKEVEELIGVFGATKAQVIGNIVEYFLNDNKNDLILNKLKDRKRKQCPPDNKIIEQRITNILKGANIIPLNSFLKYLEIQEDFFFENNHIWSQKYQYILEDNKIIKIK